MLLKAVGQLLSTAKRVSKSRWEKPKGYWKAFWEILKGYWKATEKYQNTRCKTIGEEVELPSGFWQKRGKFPSLFSEVLRFCLHFI